MQRDREHKETLKNFEYLNNSQDERNNQYRKKIEGMNGKIYDNMKKYNEFHKNHPENNNLDPSLFDLKHDLHVNRNLAELKDKDKMKNYNAQVEQRMKEVCFLLKLDGKTKGI